jgi:hypothetical protein
VKALKLSWDPVIQDTEGRRLEGPATYVVRCRLLTPGTTTETRNCETRLELEPGEYVVSVAAVFENGPGPESTRLTVVVDE